MHAYSPISNVLFSFQPWYEILTFPKAGMRHGIYIMDDRHRLNNFSNLDDSFHERLVRSCWYRWVDWLNRPRSNPNMGNAVASTRIRYIHTSRPDRVRRQQHR
mmetsp:Transcript_18689/g.38647  ORF Transcript_18689/g.38647 Transcript_18689/m.38647 type:complete len:103 (+) Transcript_18689:181-489(+)